MLQRIYRDEIRHVAAGTKWFGVATKRKGISPENHYQNLVNCHFRGALKPLFNDSALRQAGLTREYNAAVARSDWERVCSSERRPLPQVNEFATQRGPRRNQKNRGRQGYNSTKK